MCAYYLVNIPEPMQFQIYTLDFPFDLRCESVLYAICTHEIHFNVRIYQYLPQMTNYAVLETDVTLDDLYRRQSR